MIEAFNLRPFEDGDFLAVHENVLCFDGADLCALAERFGTPLFVYSERRLLANARELLMAFRAHSPRTRVCFASKACANLAVLRALRAAGIDLEVNSGGELAKAKQAGFEAGCMVFNGVAKSRDEIALALDPPIGAINVDSPFELARIAEVAAERGVRARVALRAVPGVEGGSTAGIETGSARSKFGMTEAELSACVTFAVAHRDAVAVVGLHVHIGSQMTDIGLYRSAADYVARRAAALRAQVGDDFEHVNIGGGFPRSYVKYNDQAPEIGYFHTDLSVAQIAAATVPLLRRELGPGVEILVEPGRSMVSDAAVCLARIEGVKHRDGVDTLYLDTGNSVLPESGFGWYFHMVNASRAGETEVARFRVAGPLCDSLDVYYDTEGEARLAVLLADEPALAAHADLLRRRLVKVPPMRELQAGSAPGDVIAVLDTGAYQLEMANHYCGRLRPAAVMVAGDGEVRVIRRRDTLEDLVAAERPDA